MKNNKILYLSFAGLTSDIGQSQIVPLLLALAEKNVKISVISVEKNKDFEILGHYVEKALNEHNISWEYIFQKNRPTVVSVVNDIKKMRKIAYRLQNENKFNTVYCRNYLPSIIGLKLKQRFGVKFIFDIRSFWADEQIDNNIIKKYKRHHRLVYNYIKKKENLFIKNADYIFTLTEKAKDTINKKWNAGNKTTVLPPFVDAEKCNLPNKQQQVIDALNIAFAGSISPWYKLDEMLDLFKKILEKYPKSKFYFFTGETPASILNKAIVRDINIEHFNIKHIAFNEYYSELNKFDLALFFVKDVFSKQASFPVQMNEFLCKGIPVICNNVADNEKIINELNAGIVANKLSDDEYSKIVEKIPDLLKTDKQQIHNNIVEKYSLKATIDKISDIIIF